MLPININTLVCGRFERTMSWISLNQNSDDCGAKKVFPNLLFLFFEGGLGEGSWESLKKQYH